MNNGPYSRRTGKDARRRGKKRGRGKPLLTGLRAMQSRSTAAAAGYGAGRQKPATCRRLGNKTGVVKR